MGTANHHQQLSPYPQMNKRHISEMMHPQAMSQQHHQVQLPDLAPQNKPRRKSEQTPLKITPPKESVGFLEHLQTKTTSTLRLAEQHPQNMPEESSQFLPADIGDVTNPNQNPKGKAKDGRYKNTMNALQKAGLLDITLQTAELIKKNATLQKDIDMLEEIVKVTKHLMSES